MLPSPVVDIDERDFLLFLAAQSTLCWSLILAFSCPIARLTARQDASSRSGSQNTSERAALAAWTLAELQCPTTQHLQAELDDLQAVLDLGEREDTWEKMERAIIRFAAITRGGGYKLLPLYVEGVGRKGVGLQLAACVSPALAPASVGPY